MGHRLMRTCFDIRRFLIRLCLLCAGLLTMASQTQAATYYVIVSGLGGEPDYEQRFTAAATDLEKLFSAQGANAHTATLAGQNATTAKLTSLMSGIASTAKSEDDFVLILIGHGSFDGTQYKFNIPGPDLSAEEIAAMCDRIPSKRQLIVDTTSTSGGSVPAFRRSGRAIIAATKSGTEKNATVFARYWVQALQDPASDTDKSQSISALEAFHYATQKTAAFYESQKRLATEHAVFTDLANGDPVREPGGGQGALISSFVLLRLENIRQLADNPAKYELLMKKEELEQKIDTLKYQKAAMEPADYKKQLTEMLLELARTQQELDR